AAFPVDGAGSAVRFKKDPGRACCDLHRALFHRCFPSDLSASMNATLPYFDKPSPWSSHSRIAASLKKLPAQSRVLDIGTASGTLARMCQAHPLQLFGVEPNPDWARSAAPLYEKIFVGSIQDAEDGF